MPPRHPEITTPSGTPRDDIERIRSGRSQASGRSSASPPRNPSPRLDVPILGRGASPQGRDGTRHARVLSAVESLVPTILSASLEGDEYSDTECSEDSIDRLKSRLDRIKSGPSGCLVPSAQQQVSAHATPWLPDSPWRTAWDVCFLVLNMIEATIVLLSLGFRDWDTPPSAAVGVYLALCTVFFAADIFVKSRTAVLQGWQLVDTSISEVRHIYVRGWMGYDLLCTVPFDLLVAAGSSVAFRILSITRLLRARRVHDLFSKSNPLLTRQRPVKRGLIFVYYFVLSHHCVAIIWVMLTCDGEWATACAGDSGRGAVYNQALYWAVVTLTSVGYGDITPGDSYARAYTIIVMILGVGIYAYVLGNVSFLVSEENFREKREKAKKLKIASLMEHYDIPWHVQKAAFSIYPTILEMRRDDYTEVLSELPPYMQERIGHYIKVRLISNVPMFKGVEEEVIDALAVCLENCVIAPAQYIIEAGDLGREMYLLAHGLVEVLRVDADGVESAVACLREGSWFGEIAVLKETRRMASVRTVTSCDLFTLQKNHFLEILAGWPDSRFEHAIRNEVERRLTAVERVARCFANKGAEGYGDLAGALSDNDLRSAFHEYDADDSGCIDMSEMRLLLRGLGFEFDEDRYAALFAEVDEDGSGEIDFEEFAHLVRTGIPRLAQALADEEEEMFAEAEQQDQMHNSMSGTSHAYNLEASMAAGLGSWRKQRDGGAVVGTVAMDG